MPSDNTRLHIVDEIGRMELCSDKFRDAVLNLLASPVAVFGALPAPRYGHTLELVEEIKQRADTAVLTLTKANRDATAVQIEELLTRLIKEGERGAGEGLGGEGRMREGRRVQGMRAKGRATLGLVGVIGVWRGERSGPRWGKCTVSCGSFGIGRFGDRSTRLGAGQWRFRLGN
ncbi:hypothetical protein CLOP_g14225 [Closterium sp. NIES-67]|nr:hypothetical protein CLOP_g14225 [Closterium sp. NIES-67]